MKESPKTEQAPSEMPTEIYRTACAVLAVIVAVLALSLGDAIIKATSLSLPLWQMYILRSALVLPVLWWLARRKGDLRFSSIFWVGTRSTLLVVMWLCYYVSLPLMPLSLAAAAYYTSPIMITVIAAALARRWPAPRALFAIALGFSNVADLFRVSKYPQFTLNLALIFGHKHLPLPKSGRLKEMSRE